MVSRWQQGVWAALAALVAGPATAMEALNDEELAGVRAQEGVSIGLELRINTDSNGDPLNGTLTDCGDVAVANFTNSDCRFGLTLAGNNRQDEWLLFRGVFGSLVINDIKLDAGTLSDANPDSTLHDADRYKDAGGNCLLPGGSCTNAALTDGDPALVFQYPSTNPSYDTGNQTSSGYDSLELGYTIEETRIVFKSDGFTDTTETGSFLGVQISDNNQRRAGVAISGQAYVYGF
jgi:hypothetical protein